MKEKLQAKAKDLLNNKKKLVVNGVSITRVDVYEKVADLNTIPEKYIKTERKLNVAVVNEYLKENKALPEGVAEVKKYTRIQVKKYVEPKPFKRIEVKVPEASKNFMDNFKKNAKKLKRN